MSKRNKRVEFHFDEHTIGEPKSIEEVIAGLPKIEHLEVDRAEYDAVVAERDRLREQLGTLKTERDDHKEAHDRAWRINGELHKQIVAAASERESLQDSWRQAREELERGHVLLQNRLLAVQEVVSQWKADQHPYMTEEVSRLITELDAALKEAQP